jgi:hypothetical protein
MLIEEPTPAKPEAPKQDRAQAISDEFAYGRPDLAEAIHAYGDERVKDRDQEWTMKLGVSGTAVTPDWMQEAQRMFNKDREDKIKGLEVALAAEKERAENERAAANARAIGEGWQKVALLERAEAAEAALACHDCREYREATAARGKARDAEVARFKTLVEDCEREHPPEPEYLAWQQAGKPDVAAAERRGAEAMREKAASRLEPWPQTYGNAPAVILSLPLPGDK